MRKWRGGNQCSGENAEAVETGKNENVKQSNLLEIKRIQHGKRGVSKQCEAEFRVEEETQAACRGEQDRRGEQTLGNRDIAGGEWPLPLPWMLAIGMEIEEVVENIESGGA